MSILSQRSLAGGEIAPALYARTDMAKYQAGLRTCRNTIVMRHGGAHNRPGTKYIATTKASGAVRLVPFVFSDAQTYVLEFGDGYIRFYQDGAQLGPGTVTAWANATAYAAGDLASYGGVNYHCMASHTSATANDRPSTGTNWQTYWYAMPAGVLEISSPYAVADLAGLKWTQSADVMTFVHADFRTHELTRLGALAWTFNAQSLQSFVQIPTAVLNDGAGVQTQQTIVDVTKANPAVFTVTGHGYSTGDVIAVKGLFYILGTTYYINFDFKGAITVTGADTFTIVPQGSSTAYDTSLLSSYTFNGGTSTKFGTSASTLFRNAYVVTAVNSGGVESAPSAESGTSTIPTSASVVNISWTAVSGITKYNVYKKLGAVYGFIGTADRPLFTDNGIEPDATLTAPFSDLTLFQVEATYPSCVGYYQQRLFFGNSNNAPETVWASRTGDFKNFSKRQPLQDDDSIQFSLAGRRVAAVKHIMDLGKLLVFASTGEYFCNGNAAGIITPTDVNLRQHSNFGANDLQPVQIGNNALFVQARGSIVRDLGFDWQTEGYKGNDLTIFSVHLFEGYTLVDWAYQTIPHSIVWAVRSDGTLLGLTYLPEHQIWGWHRHDTDGLFESVCTVPEGTEDSVYVVVKRTINGSDVRYVERMATRLISSIEDSVFVDSALTYDGTQVGSVSMTLSGGTTWARGEELTLTASAGTFTDGTGASVTTFVSGDVGNQIHITYGGVAYRCTITGYTSATVVNVRVERDVPVGLRSSAQTTWGKAVDEISGLEHLEGEDVSVFADGFVVANPNNASYTVLTVSSGAITLPRPRVVIHVGLPYTSDLQTLDIDTVEGRPLVDKKKLITSVVLGVERSRGLWAGTSEPDDDTVGADTSPLFEYKARNLEDYDEATDLATGPIEIPVNGEWNNNGRVFIRQSDPVPMTILSINPGGVLPQ